jgi:hypothetical protein
MLHCAAGHFGGPVVCAPVSRGVLPPRFLVRRHVHWSTAGQPSTGAETGERATEGARRWEAVRSVWAVSGADARGGLAVLLMCTATSSSPEASRCR